MSFKWNNPTAVISRCLLSCLFVACLIGCDYGENDRLIVSIIKADIESVRSLLSQGANPNVAGSDGLVPLMVATGSTRVVSDNYVSSQAVESKTTKEIREIVELLLENGANPNYQDKLGRSPLFNAVYHRKVSLVDSLLENGANPNMLNKSGLSPLYYAIYHCYGDVAEVLLENGADDSFRSPSGETLREVANRNACEAIPLSFEVSSQESGITR